MASLRTAAKAALVSLSAAGYYATWYFLLHNGTASLIRASHSNFLLPGTKEPLRTVFTGIPAVDSQLRFLTLFYWELVDGSLSTGSLFCFYFATQMACGWGLLVMEGLRGGNRRNVVSFVGVWGVLMQNTASAVLMPIWCLAHLSLSRTVESRRLADFVIGVPDLAGISVAMVFAYLDLTIVMSFPAPSVLSYELKQCLVAFWQLFPAWVSLVQGAVAYLLPIGLGEEEDEASQARPDTNITKMKWMRPLYAGLLLGAALGQAKTLALMWSSMFLPGLFAHEFRGIFDFSNVFVPAATSPFTPMPSIGAGAFLFLQYDYFVAAASLALWSTVLFVDAYRKGRTRRRLALLIAGGFVALITTGPMGYATVALWARDELIVAEAADDDGKKTQ